MSQADTTHDANTKSPRRGKWFAAIVVLVALISFASWVAHNHRGWLFPIRIGSASMAPLLKGPHLRMQCADCQIPYFFGFDSTPNDATSACPNCGLFGTTAEATAEPGQRVRIGRLNQPQRFDVIVAEADDELITKRILGLPGESVRIENGDVLINDQIICKNSAQLIDSSIVVHQDRFRPKSSTTRWQPETTDSLWLQTETGHEWQANAVNNVNAVNGEMSWLVYQHSVALPPPFVRGSPAPITDNCPYNQGTSRLLNRVSDCFIALHGNWNSVGTVFFRQSSEQRKWTVEFHTATGQAKLFEAEIESNNGDDSSEMKLLAESKSFGPSLAGLDHAILFGYWDGHFHFVHDGRMLLQFETDVRDELTTSNRPFAIAANGLDRFQITDLVARRDIFYTDVYGTNEPWDCGRQLGPGEYLTLGDNSPVSKDSRHAETLGVFRREQIVGQIKDDL